jgi:GrpB-like predicted nucleotidyltransferase (UPF0157 family)
MGPVDWDKRKDPALGDPVEVVEYDASWAELFERERGRLREALGPAAAAIEHVGSTAVPGLAAKPVLDILVGAAPFPLPDDRLVALAGLGYEYRGDNGVPGRQFFRTNPRTRHLHVVEFGGEEWERLILFRDYCRVHPEVATEYEALKRTLATDYPRERERYTAGKAAFIQAVLRRARAERA